MLLMVILLMCEPAANRWLELHDVLADDAEQVRGEAVERLRLLLEVAAAIIDASDPLDAVPDAPARR